MIVRSDLIGAGAGDLVNSTAATTPPATTTVPAMATSATRRSEPGRRPGWGISLGSGGLVISSGSPPPPMVLVSCGTGLASGRGSGAGSGPGQHGVRFDLADADGGRDLPRDRVADIAREHRCRGECARRLVDRQARIHALRDPVEQDLGNPGIGGADQRALLTRRIGQQVV